MSFVNAYASFHFGFEDGVWDLIVLFMTYIFTRDFIIKRRFYSVDNVMSKKSYEHTCNNTLVCIGNAIGNVRVNNVLAYWNNFYSQGDNIPLKRVI